VRSMWKGSISFGLISIPIKLYAASESKDVRFNLLHLECSTPVQYRKWCAKCEREINQEEIVKGYEFERGRLVVIGLEELESIPVAATKTIDIVDFGRLDQIDPVYYDKSYYLEPSDGGGKAYALLHRAMEQTGRIAIARVVITTKESLAAIRTFKDGVLTLHTMHFPEEVRSPAGLTRIVVPELRPQEVGMATSLIASLTGDCVPEKVHNHYRKRLLETINAQAAESPPERGRVLDLMEALRASVRQAEAARSAHSSPESVPRVQWPE